MPGENQSVFQPVVPQGQNQGQIFSPIVTPVNKSSAEMVGLVGDVASTTVSGFQDMGKKAAANQQLTSFGYVENQLNKMVLGAQQDPDQAKSLAVRADAVVRAAAVNDPLNAPAIRARSKEILGYVPSESIVADLDHAKKQEQANNDMVQTMAIKAAAEHNAIQFDAEGKPDQHETALKGIEILARDKKLDEQAKIYALRPGQQAAKLDNAQGAVSSILNDQISSVLPMLQTLSSKTGVDKQAYAETISQGAIQLQAQTDKKINAIADKLQIDPAGRAQLLERSKTAFSLYQGLASSPQSEVEATARNVKLVNDKFDLAADAAAPHVKFMQALLGPAAFAATAGTNPDVTKAITSVLKTLPSSVNNLPEYIPISDASKVNHDNFVAVAQGQRPFEAVYPEQKQPLIQGGTAQLRANLPHIESMNPTQLTSHANIQLALSKAGEDYTDPSALSKYFGFFNDGGINRGFNYTATKSNTADKSKEAGQNIVNVAKSTLSKIDLTKDLTYDAKTDTIKYKDVNSKLGKPVAQEALRALETYSKFDPELNTPAGLKAYKQKLFGITPGFFD